MLRKIIRTMWILFAAIAILSGITYWWMSGNIAGDDAKTDSGSKIAMADSAIGAKKDADTSKTDASEAASSGGKASSGEEQSTAVDAKTEEVMENLEEPAEDFSLEEVEPYTSSPYTTMNDNEPYFDTDELTTEAFEYYSDLDDLGRCGVTFANVCQEIMPTEERGEIGMVKPSGWHTVKYMGLVDGNYLYNRCHLIGYQLSGENANEENLITGTRYMNVEGMLPFENEVAEYVEKTNRHVLYRVTPEFDGDDLLASGVLMEAYSVEDKGKGVEFCVYCYDVQPEIEIDYATGESELAAEAESASGSEVSETAADGATNTSAGGNETDAAANTSAGGNETDAVANTSVDGKTDASTGKNTNVTADSDEVTYVCNTNTRKFHYPSCSSVSEMKDKNKREVTCSRDELLNEGYSACQRCNP